MLLLMCGYKALGGTPKERTLEVVQFKFELGNRLFERLVFRYEYLYFYSIKIRKTIRF